MNEKHKALEDLEKERNAMWVQNVARALWIG
jgi:hypothetical protein